MKKTFLLLVCAFALFTAVAQDANSGSTPPSMRLVEIMDGKLQSDKDSIYAIEVTPHTAYFMQLLAAITLAGDVPPKINYFFQSGSLARFVIVPRAFQYPSLVGIGDYYECDYQYGQLKWNYNMHTQTCENVTVRVKSGNSFNQFEQLYDMQKGLLSLLEDVVHKRLYDFPVINFRDRKQLDKLPKPVFGFLDRQDFHYDSTRNYYSITIEPGLQDADEMFALLNRITKKTKGSTRPNTYQLVTPTMDIPIYPVAGVYLYSSYDNNISWYANNKGEVFQVHIWVPDISKATVQMVLTQHVLSLVANDIQQDMWTVDNHL